jgi:hypothetical protein
VTFIEPIAPSISANSLQRFVRHFDLEQPKRVAIRPERDSTIDACYVNVGRQVDAKGGIGVYGWKIMQFGALFLQGIHHSVWVNPKGQMLDITPDVRKWTNNVFSSESNQVFSGAPQTIVMPIFFNICGLPEVDELIDLSQDLIKVRIRQALPGGPIPQLDVANPFIAKMISDLHSLMHIAELRAGNK